MFPSTKERLVLPSNSIVVVGNKITIKVERCICCLMSANIAQVVIREVHVLFQLVWCACQVVGIAGHVAVCCCVLRKMGGFILALSVRFLVKSSSLYSV